jgi:hypothetical protein
MRAAWKKAHRCGAVTVMHTRTDVENAAPPERRCCLLLCRQWRFAVCGKSKLKTRRDQLVAIAFSVRTAHTSTLAVRAY